MDLGSRIPDQLDGTPSRTGSVHIESSRASGHVTLKPQRTLVTAELCFDWLKALHDVASHFYLPRFSLPEEIGFISSHSSGSFFKLCFYFPAVSKEK